MATSTTTYYTRAEGEPVESEATELNVGIWCLTAFSWLFLALRIYCKVWRRRSLWWDDYILILAWTSILASTVMLSVGVKYGIGLHYDDMRPDYIPVTAQLSYAAGFCAIMGTAWSKTSFALTMLRITTGPTKWFLIFIIITVNLVLGGSGTMLWISCWPTPKLWYPDIEGRCWDREVGEKYQTFASAYSATMDIVLALLPWRIVWNAKLNKREMVGALLAMSAGVISGVITYLKILVLPEISDDDSTTVTLKVYGTAEPAVAIIAASIPVLRAFLQKRPKSHQTPTEGSELSNITSLSSPRMSKGTPERSAWQQESWQTGKSTWQHYETRASYKG